MWNSEWSVPKRINDTDTQRFEVPEIPHQQRQSVMGVRRCDNGVGETRSEAGCAGLPGKPASDARNRGFH